MSAYVSMLRGINVGGRKKIHMETLRGIYEDLGFTRVSTYVQSGNVVFESTEQNRSNLVKQIETRIEQACGYPVPVFIRQSHDLQRILTGNPFLNGRNENLAYLHVTFLYQPAPENAWSKLTTPDNSSDEFYRDEMEIYLYCPNGYGKTKLSNSFFERKLGTPTTTRNWNTVKALYSMVMEEP